MFGHHLDEGYIDEEVMTPVGTSFSNIHHHANEDLLGRVTGSVKDCEELAYQLLASLPRSRLAVVQRRLAPLLQFDVVGSLPDEVSLQIFSHLPSETLLLCGLVSNRWHTLANDQTLWKNLCHARGWFWRESPARFFRLSDPPVSDDEGMGDSDEEDEVEESLVEQDSGFVSMSSPQPPQVSATTTMTRSKKLKRHRHSSPPILPPLIPSSSSSSTQSKANYKLLHQTHVKLNHRFLTSSYRLSSLQSRTSPPNQHHHTSTIYCLQLYTYPTTGEQVLFTGSRDKTIREWSLSTGAVKRVIEGVHMSSVLTLCVRDGWLASGGSDRRVALWDLKERETRLVKVIREHEDSVLCVRFDEERLVSCSKDRTVRVYAFPSLNLQTTLTAHRAAVNAVSLSPNLIVSGSGDRSIRLWDAKTGKLLRTFENHHNRGIASIDFRPPYVLSGSSDKHLRVFDIGTLKGWSTSDPAPAAVMEEQREEGSEGIIVCQACGSPNAHPVPHAVGNSSEGSTAPREDAERKKLAHADLVRSVALGDEFVVSGSYDLTVKVWDRKTGALIADLTGGHAGRIFCVGGDCTKIISCGEDQRICIWDFSHGIDTSFLQL